MKVILFGGTGMIGQGVLRECLASSDVESILAIGRSPVEASDPKLTNLVRSDLFDYTDVERELSGYHACFYCLGVSSAGMSEDEYRRVTVDLTMAAAEPLARLNPGMTFVFVSGAGTDSSEKGGTMWARVKGAAENRLLTLPFRAAYMFRPAFIQPLHGIKSRTRAYRILYVILGPLYPLLKFLFPAYVTTTDEVARAMIKVAREGYGTSIIENKEIAASGS